MRIAICVVVGAVVGSASAADWAEFRGPTGQGHYAGKPLPTEWSKTKNVVWKTAIPGKGWSSPIVVGDRLFLTSAVAIPESKDYRLDAICVDAGSGKIRWTTELFVAKAPKAHNKNSHASPTPISDGKRVYVHFGHLGVAALDLDGKIAWKSEEHRYSPVHGNGGSPILVGERLVYSIDGGDKQMLVALNVADGKTAWTTNRQSKASRKFSFSTPLLVGEEIVSPASDMVVGYDAKSGAEKWRAGYQGYSVIPRPVHGHGMIFLSSGYDSPSVYAVKLGGSGDVTKSHIAWSLRKGAPHMPSLLLVGDELYMVSDNGVASCVDAKTGTVHWQERVGGGFSASPFYADGLVYLQSEQGETTVVKAGTTYEVVSKSDVGERTFASYAAVDGALFLRSETQLYRLERK